MCRKARRFDADLRCDEAIASLDLGDGFGPGLVDFVADTCIEGTARFGKEVGYHVTLVKDATAGFDKENMHAAREVNGPRFVHAIPTTEELRALLPERE